MNKKGFTLVELLATIIIIGLIMAIVLPSASKMSRENQEEIYHKYEDMLEEYAAIDIHKEEHYIDLEDLSDIPEVKNKYNCEGYILIDHETDPPVYNAYIKCPEYTTPNYDEHVLDNIKIPSCLNPRYNGVSQDLVKEDTHIPKRYVLQNNKRTEIGEQNVIASLVDKNTFSWDDINSQEDKVIRRCKILPLDITVKADDQTKVYDGTTISADSSCTVKTVNNKDVFPSNHTVTCTVGSITNKDVGSYTKVLKTVRITNQYGVDVTSNFNITDKINGVYEITPKTLTPTVTAQNKVYNRSTTATCGGTATLSGIVSGDTVSATVNTSGTFDTMHVGNEKTVTCTGITLSGASAKNYVLSSDTATTTANITPKSITPVLKSCTNKTYDGNKTATCTPDSPSGVLSGDSVTTSSGSCTFASADAGTGITVTCTGIKITDGTNKDNYSLSKTSLTKTADISKQKCKIPTNLKIATNGKVTWTASSNCSTAQHQIKIASGSYSNADSGVDKKSDITAATGAITVKVKSLALNNNYSASTEASKSIDVYSVTLSKGTGIDTVSGAGNYISGAKPKLGATLKTGYSWSKWTKTSGGDVSTTNAYSATIKENWAYTATATANKYTITYNANGGDGAPSAQTYTYAPSGTVDLSSTVPTKTGYTFLGWSTTSTATSATYAAGSKWNKSNANNYTLYAVWSINSYYLDLNGALDGSNSGNISGYGTCDVYINKSRVSDDVADYYTQHPYNTSYEIKDCKATTGHTYNGLVSGSPALSGKIGAGNVGVRVSFSTNTYKITYDANGGSNPPTAQTYTYATSGTTTLSSTKPTRTGYTFKGWSTSNTATSASYAAGSAWNLNNANNYTLYAVWSANTYKITYDANGGSNPPTAQTYTYAASGTTTLSSTKPTRTGYTFKGWSTSNTATSASYAAGSAWNLNNANNYTLYAVWSINSYTITFNGNGGTSSESSRSVNYGSAIGALPLASKTGYTFMGWYTCSTCNFDHTYYNNTYSDLNSTFHGNRAQLKEHWLVNVVNGNEARRGSATNVTKADAVTGNMTLYAGWEINSYTITFNGNGGTPTESSRSVNYGSAIGALPLASKTGYTFMGWYTCSTCNFDHTYYNNTYSDLNNAFHGNRAQLKEHWLVNIVNGNEARRGSATNVTKTDAVTENKTLYAGWEINTYTITFNGNGGTASETNRAKNHGDTIGTLPTATRSGYQFMGWYSCSTCNFDYVYYNNAYEDLNNAFNGDQTLLTNHWINNIINGTEARRGSATNLTKNDTITSGGTYYAGWRDSDGNVSGSSNNTSNCTWTVTGSDWAGDPGTCGPNGKGTASCDANGKGNTFCCSNCNDPTRLHRATCECK